MAKLRKYRLSDTSQDVDLRQYEDEIIDTINDTVPGKHPKVYADHFTTDQLTHSEAVRIGRARYPRITIWRRLARLSRHLGCSAVRL